MATKGLTYFKAQILAFAIDHMMAWWTVRTLGKEFCRLMAEGRESEAIVALDKAANLEIDLTGDSVATCDLAREWGCEFGDDGWVCGEAAEQVRAQMSQEEKEKLN